MIGLMRSHDIDGLSGSEAMVILTLQCSLCLDTRQGSRFFLMIEREDLKGMRSSRLS
jgi:hypothetical protein